MNIKTYHLRVNGRPYCVAESSSQIKMPYPTNCAHGSMESAQEGLAGIKSQQPEATVEVVEGPCHDDPFWQTEEGRERIKEENEFNEMRWNAYED